MGGIMEEREEGEISEGELSDISSEEEYLLRQRLKVLESYNNVLERKEAKRRHSETSQAVEPWADQANSRTNERNEVYDELLPDLSDISGSDLENSIFLDKPKEILTIIAKTKQLKSTKKRNEARKVVPRKKKYEKLSKHLTIVKKDSKSSKIKTHKEKTRKHNVHKKQVDSSDDTDYEYRNKRRRLQHSVQINNNKSDMTSSTLKMRLMKMFNDKTNALPDSSDTPYEEQDQNISGKNGDCISILDSSIDLVDGNVDEKSSIVKTDYIESIVLSDDSKHNFNDVVIIEQTDHEDMCPVAQNINSKPDNSNDALSDDDIEVLRQNALQTKSQKPPVVHQPDHISDSEDELRVICLRSKFLKKALELKRKHKLTKKIADMNNFDDILASKLDELSNGDDVSEHSHDTDIESVDMEIGVSDGPDTDDNALKGNEFNIATFNEVTAHIESENKQQEEATNKFFERHLFIQSEDLKSGTVYERCNNFDLENIETNSLRERRTSTKSKEIEVDKLREPHLSTPSNVGEMGKLYDHCVSVPSKDGKSEDVDEDEDLLRAKLLTSLSNNLALSRKKSDKTSTQKNHLETPDVKMPKFTEKPAPEPKRFIINIGESDSGSDNETTKNLTKMHMKLAENVDFQQRLDMFLKNARKESEKNTEEDHASSLKSKSPEKFVPKAVNHLPKSGQLEYKRLVRRIAELEKLKQNRQAALNSSKINNGENVKITFTGDETRVIQRVSDTTAVDTKRVSATALENQIALSRKRIAAESSKMLRLKEESNKLSQKHKMVITELRNIRTAMNINKREITTVQVSLAQMRNQHQLLLKRSTTQLQKAANYGEPYRKNMPQQNFESKNTKGINNRNKLKSVTVSVINDLQENIPEKPLSVQLDLSSMKKTVSIPKESSTSERKSDPQSSTRQDLQSRLTTDPGGLSDNDKKKPVMSTSSHETSKETFNQTNKLRKSISSELDDYRSPLTSMKVDVSWKGDPHGILCPYEVLGTCKDAECRYQHPDLRN